MLDRVEGRGQLSIQQVARMLLVQAEQLSPFDVMLLREICQVQRDLQRPAPSRVLADRLAVPSRTMRYYLRRLEQRGFLSRPNGRRSGYQAARPQVMPVIRAHEAMWSAGARQAVA